MLHEIKTVLDQKKKGFRVRVCFKDGKTTTYTSAKGFYNHHNKSKQCSGIHVDVTSESYLQFSVEYEGSDFCTSRFRKPRNDKEAKHQYPQKPSGISSQPKSEDSVQLNQEESKYEDAPLFLTEDMPLENSQPYEDSLIIEELENPYPTHQLFDLDQSFPPMPAESLFDSQELTDQNFGQEPSFSTEPTSENTEDHLLNN